MNQLDWGFTEDGDLAVGDPQTDINGEILYLHMDGTVSTEMNEMSKPIRDIHIPTLNEAEKSIIMNRLRTDNPDWYHHPRMGGDLTDMIGEPNSRETGWMGADRIVRALTYDGLYAPEQVSVRPVPITASEILFMIEIAKNTYDRLRMPLVLDLDKGLLDYYVPETPVSDVGEEMPDVLEEVPESSGEEGIPDAEEIPESFEDESLPDAEEIE